MLEEDPGEHLLRGNPNPMGDFHYRNVRLFEKLTAFSTLRCVWYNRGGTPTLCLNMLAR